MCVSVRECACAFACACVFYLFIALQLIASGEFGCSEEALTIAAMLSVQSVFLSRDFKGPAGMRIIHSP